MSSVGSKPSISFEFFPPKTEKGKEKLIHVRKQLSELQPEFFSVTYGAGGSTRDNTAHTVKTMRAEGLNVAPHLSFGADDEDLIHKLISDYKEAGISRIVALRGDVPEGMEGSGRLVYASALVSFLREHFKDSFEIHVAAYPEIHPDAKGYDDDIRFLKEKLDAGANSAITQYFFNPDAYFYFVDQCHKAGIDKPIIPGIMPITNFSNLARFSDACGAEIPRWMRQKLQSYGDDVESITAFGIDVVSELCEILIDNGAPGFHFYTMNQVDPTATIVRNVLSN